MGDQNDPQPPQDQPSFDRRRLFATASLGVGVAIGAAVGTSANNIPLGIGLGIVISLGLATLLNRRARP